jgi:hypothetical protein
VSNLERREALLDLILVRIVVADAVDRLKQFPWDSTSELVTLTRVDAQRVLDLYLRGALTESAVGQWANAVEGRDDIGYTKDSENLLRQFVFELATPETTRELTQSSAHEWMSRLA